MTSSDPPSVSDGDPPGGQFSSGQSWGGQADGGPPRAGWGIHRLRMRRGAPPRDAVLRMEHFNVTAVEQRRRAAIERSRGRLVIAAGLFAAMFTVVGFRVAWVTIVNPVHAKMAAHEIMPPIAKVAEGSRTVHSSRTPSVFTDSAIAQFTSGGFRR